jgi:copper chaperone CopZ
MRLLVCAFVLAVPLAAELLETEITFEGTGCVSCAESLEPRLARVRGVESVELNLESSTVKLQLEEGNKARIGPLRLRVTQDGTKIVAMTAVLRGVAEQKGDAWALTVTGPEESVALKPGEGMRLESGKAYKLTGKIVEPTEGEILFEAASAAPL